MNAAKFREAADKLSTAAKELHEQMLEAAESQTALMHALEQAQQLFSDIAKPAILEFSENNAAPADQELAAAINHARNLMKWTESPLTEDGKHLICAIEGLHAAQLEADLIRELLAQRDQEHSQQIENVTAIFKKATDLIKQQFELKEGELAYRALAAETELKKVKQEVIPAAVPLNDQALADAINSLTATYPDPTYEDARGVEISISRGREIADLLRKQAATIAELSEWKRQQMEVESTWDDQEVGRMLGMPLGTAIRPGIAPRIFAIRSDRDRLGKENTELRLSESRFIAFAKYYLDSESTTPECDRAAKAALAASSQQSYDANEETGAT